jgi:hypothetical protein
LIVTAGVQCLEVRTERTVFSTVRLPWHRDKGHVARTHDAMAEDIDAMVYGLRYFSKCQSHKKEECTYMRRKSFANSLGIMLDIKSLPNEILCPLGKLFLKRGIRTKQCISCIAVILCAVSKV